ncbi:hypothetical protein GT93_01825 [Pseudomonas plecoglossicida]|nr:hypothetical protein GT93_01825 [Pseudomonas plecoglossicida]
MGIFLVPDGGSWKRKTGQKAGLEGFQSIRRNAVELDLVPETGIEPATFALRVRYDAQQLQAIPSIHWGISSS